MTTYTVSGWRIRWYDEDAAPGGGSVELTAETLTIVTRDRDVGFRYKLGGSKIYDTDAYSMRFSKGDFVKGTGFSTFTYEWSNGTSYVLSYEKGLTEFVFGIGGALLDFRDAATFDTLDTDAKASAITNPAFVPGAEIRFINLPGVQVSEHDKIIGTANDDRLYGGKGNDLLRGMKGRDKLFGDSGADKLIGGDHADILFGATGNDRLNGGKAGDLLNGERGNDLLTGGLHADTFVFGVKGAGKDTITDFQDDIDTIRLNDKLWTGTLTAQEVVDTFGKIVGGVVTLDFGANELKVKGVAALADLVDDIVIV